MIPKTLGHDLGRKPTLAAAGLDLTYDRLLVVDSSEPKDKVKQMSPAAFSAALKRDMAQLLYLPLVLMRTVAGAVLSASVPSGGFGISMTPGTSHVLLGEAASSNTKTDVAVTEVVLPANYVDGDALSLVVNAHVVGTATVKTIDASAYKVAAAGTHGADLVETAAQTITTTAADKTFVITPTGLAAGDRLVITMTMVVTEAAAGSVTGQINSARLTF